MPHRIWLAQSSPRFYLLASLQALPEWSPLPQTKVSVREILQGASVDLNQCQMDEDIVAKYFSGMDRVKTDQPDCITACFGSSYGKALLHAGSYAIQPSNQLRRFSPDEVARLLGFPNDYRWPPEMSYRRRWKLLGNSLSIPVVEYVLGHINLAEGR